MTTDIEPIPETATLPVAYERAKAALDNCLAIDECREWANKSAALASYAKQADDDSLFKMAMKIKGRAVRRMGELLNDIEAKLGGRPPKTSTGAHSSIKTRKSAALAAGLSSHQQNQAIRIANIPKREFEKAIEAEKPPTLTALAKKGTKPSTAHLRGRKPEEFSAATKACGSMRDLAEICEKVKPAVAVRGAYEHEHPKMRAWAKTIIRWTTRLQKELEKQR